MKKLILLTALLVSVVFSKSVEQLQSEWREKYSEIIQKQRETFWQSADAQRLDQHCQGGKGDKGACRKILDLQDKYCQSGFAGFCGVLAQFYLQGDEQNDIKINENKAKSYANKACSLNAVVCASMSGLFMYKNRKLALQYAEKACEMGEISDCVVAVELYAVGFGGIGKNPQKVKYYESKLCKAGVKEACE